MAAIEDESHDAIGPDARAVVQARVGAWSGEDQGLSRAWVQTAMGELEPEAAAARLGLLTALAPHQIDDATVAAYRGHEPTDSRLLALLAWSSAQAARRIGTWISYPAHGARAARQQVATGAGGRSHPGESECEHSVCGATVFR